MNVWQQWQRFSAEARSPAAGLTEIERLAMRWGEGATPLGGRFASMLQVLPEVGRLRWSVSNRAGRLEVAGGLDEVDATDRTAIGRGPGLELRLLLSRWAYGYAVDVEPHRGLRSSLRFFDAQGEALLRADLRADSEYLPYARMLAAFRNPDLSWTMKLDAPRAPAASRHPACAEAGIADDWAQLRSHSDFFALLRQRGLTRPQAYRQVEGTWAWRVGPKQVGALFEGLAQEEVPAALSLASRGAVLVHRGIVERVCRAGNALCVLDPGLRLELDLAQARELWLVQRPSSQGLRSALELIDDNGDATVVLRDGRSDHEPADPRFQALTEALRR